MAGNLADIITCAKFQDEMFRGYDITGGRISYFPINFCMGLTTVPYNSVPVIFALLPLGTALQSHIVNSRYHFDL